MESLGFDMNTIVTSVYIFFAVISIIGFLIGMRRGFYKGISGIIFVVIYAVLAFAIARLFSKTFTSIESVENLLEKIKGLLSGNQQIVDLCAKGQEYLNQIPVEDKTVSLVMTLPVIIMCPIIYLITFALIKIVLFIPKVLVERLILGPNGGVNYHGGSRLCGGVLGTVKSLLSFAVIIIPLIGYLFLFSNTIDTIKQTESEMYESNEAAQNPQAGSSGAAEANPSGGTQIVKLSTETDTSDPTKNTGTEETDQNAEQSQAVNIDFGFLYGINDNYLKPLTNNKAIGAVYSCGGKWLFNSLTSAKADGIKVSLTEEAECLGKIAANIQDFNGVPVEEYGDRQISALDRIEENINGAKIVPCIVADGVSYTSKAWLNGEEAFGYPKLNVGEFYEGTFDIILSMLSKMDRESINEDIGTVFEIAKVSINSGLIKEVNKEDADVISVIGKEEFIEGTLLAVYDNERMRPTITLISNSLVNYFYKVYDKVNDTETPWCEQVDIDTISRGEIIEESGRLADTVQCLYKFSDSLKEEYSSGTELIVYSDMESLGRALDCLRDSVFFSNSYDFLIRALLKSEMCSNMKFINDEFIDALLSSNQSMESLFKSRKQLSLIYSSYSALEKKDYENALKDILTDIDFETAQTLLKAITPDMLKQSGMSASQAKTMSNVMSSVLTEVGNKGNLTEEQIRKEAESIDKLITTAKAASSNTSQEGKVFSSAEGDQSKSGMTAEDLVNSVMESEIISASINESSTDEDGNEVENPYNLSTKLTDEDKEEAKEAIQDYYKNNSDTEDEEKDEEMKKTLSSLANVLGIDKTDLFNQEEP